MVYVPLNGLPLYVMPETYFIASSVSTDAMSLRNCSFRVTTETAVSNTGMLMRAAPVV